MGIWTILQKTEQSLRKRLVSASNAETIHPDCQALRGEILANIGSCIRTDSSGKFFPYVDLVVTLYPYSHETYKEFFAEFLQEDSLKREIMQMLKNAEIRRPDDVRIMTVLESVNASILPEPSCSPFFDIAFITPVSCEDADVPEIRLTVTRGAADQSDYRLKKDRILIGRAPEVTDREGRIIRKNDVIFLDNGDAVNATVGFSHARIWWDYGEKKFFLMDEASCYGTCIVRHGRSMEVPEGNLSGICIQAGDELYCGQACLRFNFDSVH